MDIDKYLRRPDKQPSIPSGRYDRFALSENPFPSAPFVIPESDDLKYNGGIYEPSIRSEEIARMRTNFLEVSQSNANHLRMGYILDASYIGRGNGKSAFLLHLQREINRDYGLTVSRGQNKVFALTLVPEPGGKTKTFDSFVELFMGGLIKSGIIDDCLVSLRLQSILTQYPDFSPADHFSDDSDIRNKLTSDDWFSENKIDLREIAADVMRNEFLRILPPEFPVFERRPLYVLTTSQHHFVEYFKALKGKQRTEFLFSDMVSFFLAAGFTGAYVFVDDFERVPDFQSERQKRDFALELRTMQYDGLSLNARIGFYVLVLVVHAGVPRLISNAWSQSGLDQRAPIESKAGIPKNVVPFTQITKEHTYSLVKRYLSQYRPEQYSGDEFFPFDTDAIDKMAALSEYNASRILKLAFELLERAVTESADAIGTTFITRQSDLHDLESRPRSGIDEAPTKDFLEDFRDE